MIRNRSAAKARSHANWLAGGGEMGKLIREMDWSQTPVGPIESWPQSLRTTVSLCLASNFPISIAWGPQRTQIYNDGYWPICGAKHPHSMGQDFQECWYSAWPVINEAFDRAIAGETSFLTNQRMFLDRNGYLEETFFTFSFSPIRNEIGEISGVFHPVTELTDQALAERRMKALRDLADRTADAKTVEKACELIGEELALHELDLPFALLFLLDAGGARAALVASAGIQPGTVISPNFVDLSQEASGSWPLAEVARARQPEDVTDLDGRFGPISCGPYPEPPKTAIALPILLPGLEQAFGVLIAGVSSRRPLDAAYRTFFRMLSDGVSGALANARAYEEERKRAEFLTRANRARRESQTRLRASEKKYAAAFEQSPLALTIVSLDDGRLAEVNESFERLWGYTREEALGRTPGELKLWVEPGRYAKSITQLQTGEISRIEIGYRMRSGEEGIGALASTLISINGRPHVLSSVADITERRRAEDALRESRERLWFALESAGVGDWDLDLITGKAERSFLHDKCFGATEPFAEWSYDKFLTYVHPDDLAEVNRTFWQAVANQTDLHFEFRVVWPDGSIHWIEAHGSVYHTIHGKPARMLGVVADITDRKRAEMNLAFLAEISQDLACLTSVDEMMRTVGAKIGAFLKLSRCAFVEINEAADEAVITHEWRREDAPSIVGVYRIGEFVTGEFQKASRAGKLFVVNDTAADPRADEEKFATLNIGSLITAPLVRDGQWRFLLCAFHSRAHNWLDDEIELVRELTTRIWMRLERARVEEEIARLLVKEQSARELAEQATRAKDEFLAVVSHELRSPLNAMLGWNRFLRLQRGDDPQIAKVAETVERSGRMQLQLIEDLLDTSRITSGKMKLETQPVELANVISSALDTVRPAAAAKGVVLNAIFDPDADLITGDSGRLQQVVWNLLSNAIKFTPRGGQVWIELRRGGLGAQIVVRDTGQGISADLAPRVFDRFKQGDSSASRRFGGLGLGLSLVKHLVELHGGGVTVESPGEGQGATFTVSLPMRAIRTDDGTERPRGKETVVRQFAPRNPQSATLSGLRILVVDDEQDTLELLTIRLEEHGALVTGANSAAAAMTAIESMLESPRQGAPFDLLISDIGMPGADGYELIRSVRAHADTRVNCLPAVALTAYARGEDRLQSLQAGFQMHVSKPVDEEELTTVIAALTDRIPGARW